MLHRFIDNPEHKSRFRILKGGRISLVVSALLVSVSPVLNAATTTISDANTTGISFDGSTTSLHVTDTGYVSPTTGTGAVVTTGNLENNNFITVDGNITTDANLAILVNGNLANGSSIQNNGNILTTDSDYAIYVSGAVNGTIHD